MKRLTPWLSDIRFWIGITFVHRLFSIMQPPLEASHHWRQTTVCMVARNFYEIDPNIFFPRVDMAGNLSGITGMEFPLLNYLIYLVSLVFGYEHWYGRLINLVFSSAGIYAFHEIFKKHFNPRLAFNASVLLLFSLFYYYSRKIMPDTFSISLVFIGIWQWRSLHEKWSLKAFILGAPFILLGVLSKLPTVLVLVFVWTIFWQARTAIKAGIASVILGTGLASYAWYFYWVPHLEETYGFHHFFMGQSISYTFNVLMEVWPDTLHMFYEKALGFSGFVASGIGLFYLRKQQSAFKWIVFIGTMLFLGLMLKSASKFTNHEYYMMPYVPVMALLGGLALSELKWRKVAIGFLIVISLEGIIHRWEDQFIKSAPEIAQLEEMLDPFMNDEALIAMNISNIPTALYFTHRKGWIDSNEDLQKESVRSELREKGCEYIVVLKKRFGSDMDLPLEVVEDQDLIKIYRLN